MDEDRLQAPRTGVTIRMYRQGLGDCFLVAFPGAEPLQSYYVLVDCGVLQGTPKAQEKMNDVAEDICCATGGRIDLLVITHEHWDHVSGFVQARPVFEHLQVHNLWLAWTEDPEDKLGQQLRGAATRDQTALVSGLDRARKDGLELRAASFANLLAFFGARDLGERDLAALGGSRTQAALGIVRDWVDKSGGSTKYLLPGEVRLLPESPGGADQTPVRAYVLGPPHNAVALGRLTGHVYVTDDNSAALAGLLDPQLAFQGSGRVTGEEMIFPFEPVLRNSPDLVASHPFFKKYYARDSKASAWRRIDDKWLGIAEELALRLDSRTNNTSLVLAFELPETKRLLLFVGDAQAGNWLSWSEYRWPVPGSSGHETIQDLLARTVVYKVGHHGSQNATMRDEGLELMTHPELVAMVSTDATTASNQSPPWKIPFTPLLRRLEQRTGYGVLRSDVDTPELSVAAAKARWDEFLKRGRITPLYIEYSVL